MKAPPVNYGPARNDSTSYLETQPFPESPKLETNPFVFAWIWFWYSVPTRIVMVLLGGHFLLTLPLLSSLGAAGDELRIFAQFSYAIVFIWAMYDNNFDGKLRRIGRDCNRKKLKPEMPSP
jgi:hypothetical protein